MTDKCAPNHLTVVSPAAAAAADLDQLTDDVRHLEARSTALQERMGRVERIVRHQRNHYEWRDACTLTAAIAVSVAIQTTITFIVL